MKTINLLDGRKIEIRKIYDTKVLIRFEGFRTGIRVDKVWFNENVKESNRIN
jgi:hypothetical protein